MRLRHPDGTVVHLAYCTNVHPAEDLAGVLAQLTRYARPVRDRLRVSRLGVGLWLSAGLAAALDADPAAVRRLRTHLAGHGLEVVTLNGFPYRGFHDPVVKHRVYTPDWTSPERLEYTLRLARILAALLPDDVPHGSISTLPLAWRTPWDGDRADAVRRRLDALAAGLAGLDRTIRVGFEPEPGCVVDTSADAVRLLSEVDTRWLGVCLDACHLAVGFEDPVEVTGRLARAGLPVIKTQASCALQAHPTELAALAGFAEPRFLHQTRERGGGGVDDLADALAGGLPGRAPWRVHYHVPVHAALVPPLTSTQPELRATLGALLAGAHPVTTHVEVETYTWQVLHPDGDLVDGLARELDWTRAELRALGLVEVS